MKKKLFIIIFLLVSLIAIGKIRELTSPCANSISCVKDLTGSYDKKGSLAVFLEKRIEVPPEIEKKSLITSVLGEKTLPKRIEVNLNTQRLWAFEGDKAIFNFPVSTGKWYPTPTGVFNIWVKLRYTPMSGGDKSIGTYYYLPNVPYVMFFYNNEISKARGFSLHGTYWHNNFGHPMSHGCINMRTEDVEKLYFWTNPPVTGNLTYARGNEGTPIIIYGEAPRE